MLAPPSTPFWQTAPLWQMSPAQHAIPTAPQFMHTLGAVPGGFAQPSPALQTLPGQQFCPSPPHG